MFAPMDIAVADKFRPPVRDSIDAKPPSTSVARQTAEIVLISLIAGVALFATYLAVASLVTGQNVLAALVFLILFGAIIPSAMEDLGVVFAHRLRMYHLGGTLLWGGHQLDNTLFRFNKGATHSMNAMRLAQLSFLQNDLDEALEWGTTAATISERDYWLGKFYAHSVLGQIYFARGDWHEARNHCEQAERLYDEFRSQLIFAVLRDNVICFVVVNKDLLGRIALRNDIEARAAELFQESYTMRLQLKNRKPMAEAFREHSLGLIAFQNFQVEEAHQHFANALQLIPDKVCSDYEELTLAIEICTDATSYGTDSEDLVLQSCDKLGQLHGQGLHPRLLDLAAKPVKLLNRSSD
jgi:hypothetical protein